MDPIVSTPRLELTLLKNAERGSPQLEWLHKLHSDEQATWWSLSGRSKTIEDTEKRMRFYLPTEEGEQKTYRIAYAVHKILESTSNPIDDDDQGEPPTEFIGLVNLASLDANALPLPKDLTLPPTATTSTLTIEIAYQFLPSAWGKGYATEAIKAAFEACKRASSFWEPWTKVYVRSIVNSENPASQRVMEKTGMVRKGVYEWSGKAIWMAGRYRERDTLVIFGMHLLE